jgi:hypothetical protein
MVAGTVAAATAAGVKAVSYGGSSGGTGSLPVITNR